MINAIDRNTDLYGKIIEHLGKRIALLGSALEKDLDAAKTARTRGSITEARALLKYLEAVPSIDNQPKVKLYD